VAHVAARVAARAAVHAAVHAALAANRPTATGILLNNVLPSPATSNKERNQE
jgi:hypothetical protein